MRLSLVLALFLGYAFSTTSTGRVSAQDGSFVEGLFRTIAEAQLEREQRKRREAESALRRVNPPQSSRTPLPPGRVPSPGVGNPSLGPYGRPVAIRPIPTPPNARVPGSLEPQVQRFSDALTGLIQEIKFLTSDLRQTAASNPNARTLLPQAYQLTAQAEAMLATVLGTGSLSFAGQSYQSFDAALRQLSFQVRSAVRLDPEAESHLKNADRYLATMSRQLGTDIQVDRHALHDKMIIAATHMEALLDDLPLTRGVSHDQRRTLGHDGRLLRQAILQEADHVEEISYEQMTTGFHHFAINWRAYAARIAQLNDPHLDRRLDRIAECGEQTYALLLMTPPVDEAELQASCSRLHRLGGTLLDQLTLRAMSRMSPSLRSRVSEMSREFDDATHDLHDLAKRNASRDQLAAAFSRADAVWGGLGPSLAKISTIDLASVSNVDRECDLLRRGFGGAVTTGRTVPYENLIEIAASLEGTAEYLESEIKRVDRFIEPSSLRRDLLRASDDFHDASKELHAKLYDRRDLSDVRRDGQRMAESWQRLAVAINAVNAKGGAGGRGRRIALTMRDLQPKVASMAAALTIE